MANELFDDEAPKVTLSNGKNGGKAPRVRAVKPAPEPLADPFAEEESAAGLLTAESSTEPAGGAPLMAAPTSPAATAAPALPERIAEAQGSESSTSIFAGEGLRFDRYFSEAGTDVFTTAEWERRSAVISGSDGSVVFEQKDVEIPKSWSLLATNVVVSKYFRGKVGSPQRENSVRQIISRVADTIHDWGKKGGYFATETDADTFHDELKYLLLHQMMAFNSPVWFNLGVKGERPQCSACFINSVEDTMESILTLAKTEGMLFKWGSGTGTNFSVLRSSRENLKGGGTASGPVSFMRGFDAFAGAIKSGGKCFKKGTRVATPEGWKAIETLKVGDRVLTHRGPRPIADFMPNGVKLCYRVRTTEGYELEVTQGHKFAFWDMTAGRFDIKPIEEFAVGEAMYILTEPSEGGISLPLVLPEARDPKRATTTAEMVFPTEWTDELGYVVGLSYGDAELRRESPHRIRIAFCKDAAGRASAARFRAFGARLFGEEPLLLADEKNHQQLGYTRKRLVEFLVANGIAKGKAHALGFPSALFMARPEIRAAFIAGVLDADGSYQPRGGWSISSIDRAFLVEMQRLLLTLGVPAKLRQSRAARGNWQTLYRLHIVGHTFIERLMRRVAPYSAKAAYNYTASPGADKGWGYRPSLLPALAARIERRGGYSPLERLVGMNETTGYGALRSVADTHPHAAVCAYAAELSRCVQVTLESLTPTEEAETFDVEVEDVHLLSANGFYASNTRRAAKMVILNSDHPDIEEFIECKADSEKKAHALIEAGYSGAFNVPNGAYDSVFFQNANHSVRATDDFMRAVELDRDWTTVEVISGQPSKTIRARELMQKIAAAAWVCGDPGMQFDTTANRWHTVPNSGRINASNPCVTGDTLVATGDGWQRIDALVGRSARIYGADGQPHYVDRIFPTGTRPVFQLRTRAGYTLRLTADHKVLTANRGDVPASELCAGDRVMLQGAGFGRRVLGEPLALAIGIAVGDGCLARTRIDSNAQEIITLVMSEAEAPLLEAVAVEVNAQKQALKAAGSVGRNDGVRVRYDAQPGATRLSFSSQPVVDLFKEFAVLGEGSAHKRFTPAIFELDRVSLARVLRGLFTADGTVANYGEKSQYIALDSTSLDLLQQTQLLLLSFGIKAKIYSERRNGATEALLPDGNGGSRLYPVQEMHSLRISRSSRFVFEREIGFDSQSAKAEALAAMNQAIGAYQDTLTDLVIGLEPLGEEPVFDLTEPITSHFVANGIVVHNCSEFFFLDDTACNLASLNLMRFRRPDREFDVEAFQKACRVTITAMEILVGNAAYPTDKITVNSFDYRPLGLGYANLGALLMARGLAYDSDEGRAYAAAITAILSGTAYHQSTLMAGRVGPFAGYERNRQPFLRVMQMHRDHIEAIARDYVPGEMIEAARTCWDATLASGETLGFRNAQISVLAPTGTIGFMMDCDTTGVEPDIAIVKFKSLVGGGMFKIVNQTVPEALDRLGYSASERKAILDYIEANDTIEGAPGLADDHLSVFDCAFRPLKGIRSIHYMGHIKMMAAVQPFISGAISKTVNMPHEATPEEIARAYVEAWKLGVKALAIYRDGSKKTQPLSTGKVDEPVVKVDEKTRVEYRPLRRRLPDERKSLTHKFSVAGHEGYLTVGLYEDETPGEIFIKMSKEGSVVSGLMDAFATSISLALQYGVPLKTLVEKFMHTRFEPSGFTGNPEIPMAKSIMDYLFRYIALKFLDKDSRAHVGLLADQTESYGMEVLTVSAPGPAGPVGVVAENAVERRTFVTQADAPPCPDCGSITTRNGACYRCASCGTSIGCS